VERNDDARITGDSQSESAVAVRCSALVRPDISLVKGVGIGAWSGLLEIPDASGIVELLSDRFDVIRRADEHTS
jgi:hypothetical protein